jgi:hypothetical protein
MPIFEQGYEGIYAPPPSQVMPFGGDTYEIEEEQKVWKCEEKERKRKDQMVYVYNKG